MNPAELSREGIPLLFVLRLLSSPGARHAALLARNPWRGAALSLSSNDEGAPLTDRIFFLSKMASVQTLLHRELNKAC